MPTPSIDKRPPRLRTNNERLDPKNYTHGPLTAPKSSPDSKDNKKTLASKFRAKAVSGIKAAGSAIKRGAQATASVLGAIKSKVTALLKRRSTPQNRKSY